MKDSAGNYYSETPLTHCKYCGKRLTLTNEYDTCIECQNQTKEVKE